VAGKVGRRGALGGRGRQWLLSAVPRSGVVGRRAPHGVREQLGEDFKRLDLSNDIGRRGSGAARDKARRRCEQKRERGGSVVRCFSCPTVKG
jgi:hypothetical protein